MMILTPLIDTPVWYGTKKIQFALSNISKAYDPVQTDVRVLVKTKSGKVETRLAYFDGQTWNAVFKSRLAGPYTAEVSVNGAKVAVKIPSFDLKAKAEPFVRRGGLRGFVFESGGEYWPIGYNVAWANREVPDVAQEMTTMGKVGANWSRIWASHWDGKNPFWIVSKKQVEGEMDQSAYAKWDAIVSAAESSKVNFQFVLFHHGPYSSNVNSNWGEHPWNVKNGGFLGKPADFFVDARALALSKAWIRYAVARYGHSTSIMAWELFNEVEWVDAIKTPKVVEAWHKAMSDYVRSIDPYKHLVTTSSDLKLPIYSEADYYQPHGYPPSVEMMVSGTKATKDKPLFFGEVGPGNLGGGVALQTQAIRDGIWAALFAGHAGAAQFWTWDQVASKNLRGEYKFATDILRSSGVLSKPVGRSVRPDLGVPKTSQWDGAPGLGWAKTTKTTFRLPEEAGELSKLSAYIQGTNHREMMPAPIRLQFVAPVAGKFRMTINQVSNSGAGMDVKLDGKSMKTARWTKAERVEPVEFGFEAGRHEIEISNEGPDWFNAGSFSISGIAPAAAATGTVSGDLAVLRVLRAKDMTSPLQLSPTGLGLADGRYLVEVWDCDKRGRASVVSVSMRKGVLSQPIPMTTAEAILVIRKK